jgi:hypothetical protein
VTVYQVAAGAALHRPPSTDRHHSSGTAADPHHTQPLLSLTTPLHTLTCQTPRICLQ